MPCHKHAYPLRTSDRKETHRRHRHYNGSISDDTQHQPHRCHHHHHHHHSHQDHHDHHSHHSHHGGHSHETSRDVLTRVKYSAAPEVSMRRVPADGGSVSSYHVVPKSQGHSLPKDRETASMSSSRTPAAGSVLNESVRERTMNFPRTIVTEEVVMVPQKVRRESVVDDIQVVRERIIEVAKPVVYEKIVEVPEIEYVERKVPVPQKIVKKVRKEVPQKNVKERVVVVPKVKEVEKIVYYDEVEQKIVPVRKVVEVPTIKEEVVEKTIDVPHYVEKPVQEIVQVPVSVNVQRNVPDPLETVRPVEYKMRRMIPRFNVRKVVAHVPRFIEVPFPEELVDAPLRDQIEHLRSEVKNLSEHPAPSLKDFERIAQQARSAQYVEKLDHELPRLPQRVANLWEHNAMPVVA